MYDREHGMRLAQKYLGSLERKLQHTTDMARFAHDVASRVAGRNPELGLDPVLVGFLGYVHDIGFSIHPWDHEIHTQTLLEREGVPLEIARMAMHGQLAERFNDPKYLPVGIEGMILTYADMSVDVGAPVPVQERADAILKRIPSLSLDAVYKEDLQRNMHKALPRFHRYERVILALAGVSSAREF